MIATCARSPYSHAVATSDAAGTRSSVHLVGVNFRSTPTDLPVTRNRPGTDAGRGKRDQVPGSHLNDTSLRPFGSYPNVTPGAVLRGRGPLLRARDRLGVRTRRCARPARHKG